jgi:hypothetical protein
MCKIWTPWAQTPLTGNFTDLKMLVPHSVSVTEPEV